MKREIIVANFKDWTISIITQEDADVTPKAIHIIKYVYSYLISGNGLFIKRLISVFIRLSTASLKPMQESDVYRLNRTKDKDT